MRNGSMIEAYWHMFRNKGAVFCWFLRTTPILHPASCGGIPCAAPRAMERSDWQLLDTPAQKAVATVSMILTSQFDLGIFGMILALTGAKLNWQLREDRWWVRKVTYCSSNRQFISLQETRSNAHFLILPPPPKKNIGSGPAPACCFLQIGKSWCKIHRSQVAKDWLLVGKVDESQSLGGSQVKFHWPQRVWNDWGWRESDPKMAKKKWVWILRLLPRFRFRIPYCTWRGGIIRLENLWEGSSSYCFCSTRRVVRSLRVWKALDLKKSHPKRLRRHLDALGIS